MERLGLDVVAMKQLGEHESPKGRQNGGDTPTDREGELCRAHGPCHLTRGKKSRRVESTLTKPAKAAKLPSFNLLSTPTTPTLNAFFFSVIPLCFV
jgi:hypothetical protein